MFANKYEKEEHLVKTDIQAAENSFQFHVSKPLCDNII